MIWIRNLIVLALISLSHQSFFNSFLNKYIFSKMHLCLEQKHFVNCVKNESLGTLDSILKDKSDWRINSMISLRKNNIYKVSPRDVINVNKTFVELLGEKLYKIIQTRRLQFQLNPLEEGKYVKEYCTTHIIVA